MTSPRRSERLSGTAPARLTLSTPVPARELPRRLQIQGLGFSEGKERLRTTNHHRSRGYILVLNGQKQQRPALKPPTFTSRIRSVKDGHFSDRPACPTGLPQRFRDVSSSWVAVDRGGQHRPRVLRPPPVNPRSHRAEAAVTHRADVKPGRPRLTAGDWRPGVPHAQLQSHSWAPSGVRLHEQRPDGSCLPRTCWPAITF